MSSTELAIQSDVARITYCVWGIVFVSGLGFLLTMQQESYEKFLFLACGTLASLVRYFLVRMKRTSIESK